MKREDLKILYQNGLLSSKVFNYFEIRNKVLEYQRQGLKKTDAVNRTALLTGLTTRTIFNALRLVSDIQIK